MQISNTVQCSSKIINMLENVIALQGSPFILLLEFCVVQVNLEIQTGVVEDHSESVQQSCHWHKMSSTACHHFVFLVR